MSQIDYRYVLPVFVGHPFRADYTEVLRDAISRACAAVTGRQPQTDRGFRWYPEFAEGMAETRLKTVLAKVRALIRESALAVFEISDATNANVFFELGMAVAMEQRVVLVGRRPFAPPSDVRGYEGIEYADEGDLEAKLQAVFDRRLQELRSLPSPEQEVVFQKMQIDTSWDGYVRHASDSVYFFAGDVSWAADLENVLRDAAGAAAPSLLSQTSSRGPTEVAERPPAARHRCRTSSLSAAPRSPTPRLRRRPHQALGGRGAVR